VTDPHYSKSLSASYLHARALVDRKDFKAAEEALRPLVAESVPGSVDLLGYVLLRSGQHDSAATNEGLVLLQQAFMANPTEEVGRQLAYHYRYEARNPSKALGYYNALVAMGAWEANYQIGRILSDKNKLERYGVGQHEDPQQYYLEAAKHGHVFSIAEVKRKAASSGLARLLDYLIHRFIKLPARLVWITFNNPDDRRIRR
jgi:hypothetical protein